MWPEAIAQLTGFSEKEAKTLTEVMKSIEDVANSTSEFSDHQIQLAAEVKKLAVETEAITQDFPVKPSYNVPSGEFSNITRLEISLEEYDELVEFLADSELARFSESAKKAIREELIRMECTRGA